MLLTPALPPYLSLTACRPAVFACSISCELALSCCLPVLSWQAQQALIDDRQLVLMFAFPLTASHNKAGVTVNPTEADKNQQNTLPHLRLMEWVWSYFVATNLYEGTNESCEDDQSTKAGAVHAQPSKQTRGASHWQHQEERSSKHQKTGNQQTVGKSGADYEASGSNSSAAVTRSGRSVWTGQ